MPGQYSNQGSHSNRKFLFLERAYLEREVKRIALPYHWYIENDIFATTDLERAM
jgi:hypothetical protein